MSRPSNQTRSQVSAQLKKRTRLSPDQRREQLVRIGARLFAERPFSDVWIEEVAEQAGVSRGLVYHYFPNKRDFYAAIVRHGAAEEIRRTAPDESLPPLERLRSSIDQFVQYVEANENAMRSVLRGQHSVDAEVVAVIREGRDAQARRILHALIPGEEPSPTLTLALEGWMNFNNAVVFDWLDTRAIERDQLIDLMTRALAGILVAAFHVDGSEQGSRVLDEINAQLAVAG